MSRRHKIKARRDSGARRTRRRSIPRLPNSQFTQPPWDYLHPNLAGDMAMGSRPSLRRRISKRMKSPRKHDPKCAVRQDKSALTRCSGLVRDNARLEGAQWHCRDTCRRNPYVYQILPKNNHRHAAQKCHFLLKCY